MKTNIIYNKSCVKMEEIDDNSIDCIITSPPYWGLRDYDVAGQIGLEPTLQEYLNKMLIVTTECKRVLKSTGVMWWNHGDNYNSKRCAPNAPKLGKREREYNQVSIVSENIPVKCLNLQNYRLILKMIDEQGWILRNTVIWSKPNGMPSSVKDRLANKYEPVFMLVKNKKYWFDLDAVREPHAPAGVERRKYKHAKYHMVNGKPSVNTKNGNEQWMIPLNPFGKNPGDVWSIPTQPYPEAHFATFPEKLIIKPILSSCPEWICKKCGKARVRISKKEIEETRPNISSKYKNGEYSQYDYHKTRPIIKSIKTIGWTNCGCNAGWYPGIVLDPFAGSGTTLATAHKYHRQYIGYELNPKYLKFIKARLEAERTLWD